MDKYKTGDYVVLHTDEIGVIVHVPEELLCSLYGVAVLTSSGLKQETNVLESKIVCKVDLALLKYYG